MSETAFAVEEEPIGAPSFVTHMPTILWQRKWFLIIPTIICAIVGVAVAFILPARYRSTATLLVESQQLPSELVGSGTTSVIDKRIAKIRQLILSRPNLVQLIQANNLYPEQRASVPLSKLIDQMRAATAITPVNADIGSSPGGSNTIAFSLTFDYPEAPKAQTVTQAFVDKLLDLDTTQTAEQAAGTVDFLQEQADGLMKQITDLEGKIMTIKSANGVTLGGANMMMMGGGGGYEAQIASLQRENSQLQTQISMLNSPDKRDPTIVAAEAQLASARAIYSDNHPDVKLAEQRLIEAKRFAKDQSTTATTISGIRSQIASNQSMISQLNAARAQDSSRTSAALNAQAKSPVINEQIAQLQGQADSLRGNYRTVATSLMNARTTLKMGAEQKGERLTVIDPPVVPDSPNWPNRPMIMAMGLAVGLGLGFVAAMAFEFVRRPIRGVAAIKNLTGAQPLVVVPTLRSNALESTGRRWWPRTRRRREDIDDSEIARAA